MPIQFSVCIRQWTGSSLTQVMAYCLFSAYTFSDTILMIRQLDLRDNLNPNMKRFVSNEYSSDVVYNISPIFVIPQYINHGNVVTQLIMLCDQMAIQTSHWAEYGNKSNKLAMRSLISDNVYFFITPIWTLPFTAQSHRYYAAYRLYLIDKWHS